MNPSHFLIRRPINKTNFITEKKLAHLLTENSKNRAINMEKWSNSYLSHLQQRSKWIFKKRNVKRGISNICVLLIIDNDNIN